MTTAAAAVLTQPELQQFHADDIIFSSFRSCFSNDVVDGAGTKTHYKPTTKTTTTTKKTTTNNYLLSFSADELQGKSSCINCDSASSDTSALIELSSASIEAAGRLACGRGLPADATYRRTDTGAGRWTRQRWVSGPLSNA